ncbi:gfo/Idh/MocA family oxidoreductase [candidate division KSB1 bacterium]|nr:MAG: gfo/Idh/MocA family oxidoreductase [candidate division KSB1 bacterium]
MYYTDVTKSRQGFLLNSCIKHLIIRIICITFYSKIIREDKLLNKVKIGVIGVGHLGRFHSLNYAQLPDAELIGIYDVDKERADAVAKEASTKSFESIDELLEQVDGVSIAVPTDLHFKVAQQVLNKSIPCLIEKPIAQNLEEADTLINLARQNNTFIQVGHIERFNPAFRALSEFDIRPMFIESHRLSPFNPRGTEVAVVLDLMIHDIDIVLHLVKSPVKSIDASGVAVVSDTADIANARIHFENGCVANLTASRISQKKMRKMRMFQKDTYVTVDFLQKISEIYRLESSDGKSDMILGEIGVGEKKKKVAYYRPQIPEGDGLYMELTAFINSITGSKAEGVPGEAARSALDIAISILKQMEK